MSFSGSANLSGGSCSTTSLCDLTLLVGLLGKRWC
jgi:hypothetical protein